MSLDEETEKEKENETCTKSKKKKEKLPWCTMIICLVVIFA